MFYVFTSLRLSPAALSHNQTVGYNPPRMSTPATEPTPVRERVQSVINLIRPAVQADGGDIELVDVSDGGVVQIRFHGACHGCPSSTMTLQDGILRNLRERVPEVTQVIPVP
jgi:Fe-S cluster biogenesis protein NfuA